MVHEQVAKLLLPDPVMAVSGMLRHTLVVAAGRRLISYRLAPQVSCQRRVSCWGLSVHTSWLA